MILHRWVCARIKMFELFYSSKSKEKDNVEPVSEKKKVKEEKEDEKVEDVS